MKDEQQQRKGPKLSKQDEKIIAQNKRPVTEIREQLNYVPTNRRILCSPIPSTFTTSSGIILSANSSVPRDESLDLAEFYCTVLAIDPKITDKDKGVPYTIGDKILIDIGQCKVKLINDIIVYEVLEHQVFGYFLS